MSNSDESAEKLDTPNHIAQQRKEWLIERIGWGVMASVILAALLGGLGFGPLSSRGAATSDGALRAKYHNIERASAATKLELWCKPRLSTAKEVKVAISRSFVDEITIESFVPAPTDVMADGDTIIFTFAGHPGPGGEKVVCHYRHNDCGVRNFEIGDLEGESVRIRQFVLP